MATMGVDDHVKDAQGQYDLRATPLSNAHSPDPHLGQQVIHGLTAFFMVPAQDPKQTKYLDLRWVKDRKMEGFKG